MLNFKGGGLTVERLMYFTDWAPGVNFLEKKLFQFLLRNLCNEKEKSISHLAHARRRLRKPTFLFLAQHAATAWIRGSKDTLWRGLCCVLTHQHSVPVEGQVLLGVTWGQCVVLVTALAVRRGERGPERCVSCESPWSKVGCRCPPCWAVCLGHPMSPVGFIGTKIRLFLPQQSTLAPQPRQAAMLCW